MCKQMSFLNMEIIDGLQDAKVRVLWLRYKHLACDFAGGVCVGSPLLVVALCGKHTL